jgi:hypothetical protein
MTTPLAGLCEFTVNTYVVGGGGVLLPPPPPQAEISTLSPLIQTAAFQPKRRIACPLAARLSACPQSF